MDVETKWPDPKDGAGSDVSEEGTASTQTHQSSSIVTLPPNKVRPASGAAGQGCGRSGCWMVVQGGDSIDCWLVLVPRRTRKWPPCGAGSHSPHPHTHPPHT